MDSEMETASENPPARKRQRSSGTISLAQLEAFVAIIRHGGLQRAAHALGVDESTVRDRVTKLEEWLGKQLFFKRPTFKLAPDGRDFRATAEQVVNALVTSRNEVSYRDMAALTGRTLDETVSKKFNPVTDEVTFELD